MQLKLIETYSMVCDLFLNNPQWKYIRLSNNNQPSDFTDQEAVMIYLFVGNRLNRFLTRDWRYSKKFKIFAINLLRSFSESIISKGTARAHIL